MSREKEITHLASKTVVITKKDAALYMAARGFWKSGPSAENNSGRALRNLCDLKILESIGNNAFRWPGSRCDGGEHSLKLAHELVLMLCRYPDSLVRREVSLPCNRRADALVLIRTNDRAACIWLETVLSETPSSIANKRREAYAWPEALKFMSQQFGVEVPSFTFVTSNDLNTILED